jgi:hypothetical protein
MLLRVNEMTGGKVTDPAKVRARCPTSSTR